MREDSFAGQVIAVISRRDAASQPLPGEPATFSGQLMMLKPRLRTAWASLRWSIVNSPWVAVWAGLVTIAAAIIFIPKNVNFAGAAWTSGVSAYCFLRLRCNRVGNPFGHRARWWSMVIIASTVIVSTGMGWALDEVSHLPLAAYVGLILPSVLWFGRSSLRPLRHLDDLMGEDMLDWCNVRARAVAGHPRWVAEAAHYYHAQTAGRVKDQQARYDLKVWRETIEHQVRMAQLADLDSPVKLRTGLRSHPSTRNRRKYDPDDPRLAKQLRLEAENELQLFLFTLYRLGFYKLLIYTRRPSPLPKPRRRIAQAPEHHV